MQRVVNNYGAVAVAAFTATSRIEQLIHQPYQTLGAALSTYSGQNYGAKNKERLAEGFKKSMLMTAIFSLAMLPIMQFLGNAITRLFVKDPEVIAMGAGSCIGGFLGGAIVDKDKNNRKAKLRESLMQMGNVSIPILTVHLFVEKLFKNLSKAARAFIGLGGVAIGVILGNIVMNKINNIIFNESGNESRKIKATDFSAHFDDIVVAASYISKSDIVHTIGRLVPAALVIPGIEVGNKTADGH